MPNISTILCPTDFSEPSKAGLAHAEALAAQFDAELLLAHVVEAAVYPVAPAGVPVASPLNLEEELRKAADEALAQLVGEISGRGVKCMPLMGSGRAALQLVDWAKERDVDLVVIATHGWTGLRRVVMGSTAERVVQLCECPVLSVKSAP